MSQKNNKNKLIIAFILGMLALMTFMSIAIRDYLPQMEGITYSEFLEKIKSGEIDSVVICETSPQKTAVANMKLDSKKVSVALLQDTKAVMKALTEAGAQVAVSEFQYKTTISLFESLFCAIIIGILIFIGPMIFGKSFGGFGDFSMRKKAKKSTGVKFSDIYGLEDVKEEVMEVVRFLQAPEKFTAIGAKVPRGILLTGEPGVGKTMIAKAMANEADAYFIACSASEFVEMYVGLGAKRVRELFADARSNAKNYPGGSIIFIDEIDSVGRKRRDGPMNEEAANTLNQLLVEMDGFETAENVIVVAATNKPEFLDAALLRPGRFDRKVDIRTPNIKERALIARGLLSKVRVKSEGVNIQHMVKLTSGLSGADLHNIINEAALKAVKKDSDVTTEDLNIATEEALLGKPSARTSSEEDKIRIAYHEAGHAVAIVKLTDKTNPSASPDPIFKGTMIPRGGALGYVAHFPQSDFDPAVTTLQKFRNMIAVSMAGKVAEEGIYGKDNVSSGATGDIENATQIAIKMVAKCGFSSKLGNVSLDVLRAYGTEGIAVQGALMEEVRKIIDEQEARVRGILQEGDFLAVKNVAQALLEKTELSGPQIVEIIEKGNLNDFKAATAEEKDIYMYIPNSTKPAEKSAEEEAAIVEEKGDEEDSAAPQAQAFPY